MPIRKCGVSIWTDLPSPSTLRAATYVQSKHLRCSDEEVMGHTGTYKHEFIMHEALNYSAMSDAQVPEES